MKVGHVTENCFCGGGGYVCSNISENVPEQLQFVHSKQ